MSMTTAIKVNDLVSYNVELATNVPMPKGVDPVIIGRITRIFESAFITMATIEVGADGETRDIYYNCAEKVTEENYRGIFHKYL